MRNGGSCRRSERRWVQVCCDSGDGPAARWIAHQRVAGNFEERLRECAGKCGISGIVKGQRRGLLRERFDESDAKRPDIGSGRSVDGRGAIFGGIVDVVIAVGFSGVAQGKNRVDGEFELIGDGQEIGRFYVRVREGLAVKMP